MNPKKRAELQENITGYLFVAPNLLVFLIFIVFPMVAAIYLSFTEWNFLSGFSGIKWIGLANFKNLRLDDRFIYAIKNTFIYTATIVPISLAFSMSLAYTLNGDLYAKKFLRFFFFIPYISSQVALAAVFKFLFRDDGLLNDFLVNTIHILKTHPDWLNNDALNKIPIIVLAIWTGIGYELIIYMAALQGVPTDLYEVAEIEGVNSFQRFIYITFPLITPTTFFLTVVRIIAVFKIFASINIMTLGTSYSTNTSMVMEIYRNSFVHYKFGYASAESLILLFLVLIITLINFLLQKKWVHY
jgi:multiple sugar transport system permease protein